MAKHLEFKEKKTVKELEQLVNILEGTINLRDKELLDVKTSFWDVLQTIRDLNESSDYNEPDIRRRKISEFCTDVQYQLYVDCVIDSDGEIIKNEKNPIYDGSQP